MFQQDYKKQMNKITPDESAVSSVVAAAKSETRPKRVLVIRSVAIACLCIAIVCVSVFTAFHLTRDKNTKKPVYVGKETAYSIENMLIPSSNPLYTPNNYKALCDALNVYFSDIDRGYFYKGGNEIAEDAILEEGIDLAVPDPTGPENDMIQADDDYSGTTEQVQGVQEADCVKTDGKYIYYFSEADSSLRIYDSNNGNPLLVSNTYIDTNNNKNNVYVYGTVMILCERTVVFISNFSEYEVSPSDFFENDTSDTPVGEYIPEKHFTQLTFVDVSDPSNPIIKKTATQSGNYNSSRVTDGVLYTVSRYNLNFYFGGIKEKFEVDPDEPEQYVPTVDGEFISSDSIYFGDEITNTVYTVLTAYDLKGDFSEPISSLCLVGKNGDIYCNQSNLYIATPLFISEKQIDGNNTFEYAREYTEVIRISLNGGNVTIDGCGNVPGAIKDQFSMDEHNGYFRIATTGSYISASGGSKNNYESHRASKVFVLDKDLNVIGVSKEMGVTEEIKSVRFMGEICYVVTFRQTDPLYAVDLSDPKNPEILSELKIDGFSTYMFPFGTDLLLGIGYDADPETGRTTGLKLTMFDISNNKEVDDISSYIISYNDSWFDSEAMTNHHAVLVAPAKNIIALPITDYNHGTDMRFFGFDAENGRIVDLANVTISHSAIYGARSMYIGDYAYIVCQDCIVSLSLDEFSVTSKVPVA